MKEQIKELRVKIDGLSQLVKSMKGGPKYQLDISTKPKGLDIQEWLKIFEENNYLFVDTKQGESKGLIQPSELHKCYDSLILAKAWLGKVLGELGETTPYANDGNRKTVEDIEPTADRFKVPELIQVGNAKVFTELNHIEKVDWLREEIKKLQKSFVNEVFVELDKLNLVFYSNCIQQHLSEARFWLGFELEHIRESSTNNI